MVATTQVDEIDARTEEVHAHIMSGDLDRARRRLLDLARDFAVSDSLIYESRLHSAEYSTLVTNMRTGVYTTDESTARRAEIILKMQQLADRVKHDYRQQNIVEDDEASRGFTGHRAQQWPLQHVRQPSRLVRRGGIAARNIARSDKGQAIPIGQCDPYTVARERFAREKKKPAGMDGQSKGPQGGGSEPPEDVAFWCHGISKEYRIRSMRFQLGELSFSLAPGEITGVVGANGSGKSTLLRIVAGEIAVSRGRVKYPLLSQSRNDWLRIRRQIAYISQQPMRWFGRVSDGLHLSAALHGVLGDENNDEVEFVLERLGLARYRDARWDQLSGGFQMRLELARCLVWNPRLLVMDEPLAPLDIMTQERFLQDLKDITTCTRRSMAVIVSSQHLHEIESISDHLMVFDNGFLRYCGGLDGVGRDRSENCFELSCGHDLKDLKSILKGVDVHSVEDTGLDYVIRTSIATGGSELLGHLLRRGVVVTYFPDISHSSKVVLRGK